ncbi:MAG: hypothetical protein VR68_15505 [Peptococcaceae bacterium BRH_c4a]|nr:MAG: hypothetical protein VR68_15505 [Peptococcaceae bacterium BRH_c4a]
MEILRADVLVIGSGLAALSAAIESLAHGASVIVVDKGRVGGSGSSPSSVGNPQAFLAPDLGGDPGDSRVEYFADIVRGGRFLNNLEMVSILAEEAQEAVIEGDRWGIPFCKTPDGKYERYITSGMSYPRVGPVRGNGRAVVEALCQHALRLGARLLENIMITKLAWDGGRVIGAIGVEAPSGDTFSFQARCTVLAGGSALALYPYSSAADSTTGDAYALAWELNLPFANMEFVEFTLIPAPGGTPFPSGGIKPAIGKGAVFHNRLGERFMARYDPDRLELTNRTTLVQAVHNELKAGNGPCCLDVSSLKEPTMPFEKMEKELGIDWRREKIPWEPAVHSFLGGVIIDRQCAAGIPGLYAAGETAGHGLMFGADRVCGAVAACLVLGRRAGRNAALEAFRTKMPSLTWSEVRQEEQRWQSISCLSGDAPGRIRRELQQVCWNYFGITRSAGDLSRGLDAVEQIERKGMRVDCTKDLVEAIESKNLILASRLVAHAARIRTESRGLHQRADYPLTNDQSWLKWVVLRKEGNGIAVTYIKPPA